MRLRKTSSTVLALGALAMASASAAPQAPNDARYVFERAGNGFARMDKATGEVSYCRMESDGLVCRLAPDDRDAYERQIDELARENAGPKERMSLSDAWHPPRGRTLAEKKAEAGEEIDLVAHIMKRMIHAFDEIIGEAETLRSDHPYAE